VAGQAEAARVGQAVAVAEQQVRRDRQRTQRLDQHGQFTEGEQP